MASYCLFSTVALLLCFSAISTTTAELVTDSEGAPLCNGGTYYIIPQNKGFGGGLTTIQKLPPCPLYITKESDETSPGIPVTISTPPRILSIPENLPISIAFTNTANLCNQPLGWQVLSSATNRYVLTGGPEFSPIFRLKRYPEGENTYTILYNGEDDEGSNVGFHRLSGLLGVTDEALPVKFRRVEETGSVLKMSTSST